MRVLYVAPRYHTNQIPIVKGWIQNGHEIMFISQFAGTLEDYDTLKPIILGYSASTKVFIGIYRFFFCRKEKSPKKEFDLKIKIGLPPVKKAKKYMDDFEPDVVIVRERSLYNIPFILLCRKKKIPCILYNQSPLWDKPGRDQGWKKKILLPLFPAVRMTPVKGIANNGNEKTKGAVFVPFVIEKHFAPEEKQHFVDDKINILCVGRYEQRKNLFLLLDVVKSLIDKYEIHLVIAGEMIDTNQHEYYAALKQKVTEYRLTEKVTLLQNLNIKQIYEVYRKSDLFVLPSTRERASIAQLEAMSCSLPVICSNTNGSACYVEDGINGKLFADNSENDLAEKMEWFLSDKERLLKAGQKSYQAVCTNYQFPNYYVSILKIIGKIKNDK